MKILLYCVGIMFTLVSITSYSHTLKKPEWDFEKSAVHFHIKADNKLNLYHSMAHTLYVCFYQLEELNAFNDLTKDEAGIRQLLECRLFDDSVASSNSKVIHAGEDIVLTLDRAERAQYVAMVAGYSTALTNDRAVRRNKLQVYQTKKGVFKKVYTCHPCELNVEVSLGRNQIEYSKTIPNEEVVCNDECE